MHMTLEADYAVRIVERLTLLKDRQDAKSISEKTQVPLRFALKILRKLVSEGIVKSYKGTHGGYMLAKKPSEISLRQVIEAVEGPYMISRCLQGEYACGHEQCHFHKIYEDISQMVRDKLDTYTFAIAERNSEPEDSE